MGATLALALLAAPAEVGAQQPPDTLLHYTFDEREDATVADTSGRDLDTELGRGGSRVPGRSGEAIASDGTGPALTVSLDTALRGRELTVAFWLRSEGQDGCATFFALGAPRAHDLLLELGGNDDLSARGRGSFERLRTGRRVDDGTWHHVALTWTALNGELILYVDGEQAARGYEHGRWQRVARGAVLTLGRLPRRWSDECRAIAQYDDLLVLDRVATAQEIAALASYRPLPGSGGAPEAPSGLRLAALAPGEVALAWTPPRDDGVVGYRVYRDGALLGSTGRPHFYDEDAPRGATAAYEVEAVSGSGEASTDRASGSVAVPAGGHVLEHLPPGHWYEVRDSAFLDQLFEGDSDANPNVFRPWCGSVYDSSRDRLVLWCGGHRDGWNNALFAFDVATLRWSQLTEPTPRETVHPDVWETQDVYPDGRPAARHTYNGMQYLPERDLLFSTGGSLWGTGGCSGGTWLYDFTASPPESGWIDVAVDRGGCGGWSAYDAATGHVWYCTPNRPDCRLSEFDPANLDAPWTDRGRVPFDMYQSAAIDPVRRKLVVVGALGQTLVYDISNPEAVTGDAVETVGATEIEEADAVGFEYDPVADTFVAWMSGPEVHRFDVEENRWRRVAPAATNLIVPPPHDLTEGVFNRFRYVPRYNAYVLANHERTNVFFYKLAPWSGDETPPSAPSALRADCVEGRGVRLSWSPADDPDGGIAHYVVYRDDAELGRTPALGYLDSTATPGRTYRYAVSAVNRGGLEGARSDGVEVTVDAACVASTVPDPPGDGGNTGGDAETDGSAADGGPSTSGSEAEGEGGCGCRLASGTSLAGSAPWWLLGLWLAVRRRRRQES